MSNAYGRCWKSKYIKVSERREIGTFPLFLLKKEITLLVCVGERTANYFEKQNTQTGTRDGNQKIDDDMCKLSRIQCYRIKWKEVTEKNVPIKAE